MDNEPPAACIFEVNEMGSDELGVALCINIIAILHLIHKICSLTGIYIVLVSHTYTQNSKKYIIISALVL